MRVRLPFVRRHQASDSSRRVLGWRADQSSCGRRCCRTQTWQTHPCSWTSSTRACSKQLSADANITGTFAVSNLVMKGIECLNAMLPPGS